MELGDLYEEYANMIFRYIYLKCKSWDIAEDIVQITFLKAITQIDSFEGKCKVSTWLCQIAKNEYLNYCRKHDRQQSYEEFIEKNDTWARVTYYRAKEKIRQEIERMEGYDEM